MEHHAYYVEGSQSELEALAESARATFNFKKGSPDVRVLAFEKFGIDDAHELTRVAALKSTGGRALFVVGISITNVFAQQALLKLLEEPQQGVIFILLVPQGMLMPTVKSRLMPYKETPQPAGQKVLAEAAAFLKASYKTRSTQITALLKDDEGVRERVRSFISAIEVHIYEKLQKSKSGKELRSGLEDISKVRSYLSDQSPSLKMLLEHLAISLPTL